MPLLRLRSYKRREENKSKIEMERNSIQEVDYQFHRPTPWMQESVSMHKRSIPFRHSRMNQARSEEDEEERQERQRPGGWFKKKKKKKKKNYVLKIWL